MEGAGMSGGVTVVGASTTGLSVGFDVGRGVGRRVGRWVGLRKKREKRWAEVPAADRPITRRRRDSFIMASIFDRQASK